MLLYPFNCQRVAFDEAVQLNKETIPIAEKPSYPCLLYEQHRPLEGSKTVVTLLHSLVQTCRFWMSLGTGKPYCHQEAVLPPQCIYGTDNVTVCKSLLLGMEGLLFGCGIREWISNLSSSGLQLLLCMVRADDASSNLNVLDVFKAIFLILDVAACCVLYLVPL